MSKTRSMPSAAYFMAALFFSFQLAACGGGGGDGNSSTPSAGGSTGAPNAGAASGTPSSGDSSGTSGTGGSSGASTSPGTNDSTNPAAVTPLAIVADSNLTTSGSGNITLHAIGVSSNAVPQWSIDPQDLGRLDRTSGNTVTYIPPAADSGITDDTLVRITVTVGQTSAMTQVTLIGSTKLAENAAPNVPSATNPAPQVPVDATVPNVAGVFGVIAQTERTAAGGSPITLTASKPSATGTVSWSLDAGSVGRLSSTSGDSVQYIPPAAGSLANNAAVVVSASIGSVTKKTTVFVEGVNGLHLLAGNDYGPGVVNASGTAARLAAGFSTREHQGITRDAQGNLYVISGRTIRKITPEGSVATLAGSAASFGLADGTGTQADFISPRGITIDAAGNLYVVNTYGYYRYSYSVRKITPAGVVTTFANRVIEKGEPRHSEISGVAIDSAGDVYVSDTKVYKDITKITATGTVTTVATNNSVAFNRSDNLNIPRDITFDTFGNFYVLDSGIDFYLSCGATCNYYAAAIRKVNPDGTVVAFAGPAGPILAGGPTSGPARDGTGTDARFTSQLHGMAIDATGNLYVTDRDVVRRITPDAVVTTLPGKLPEVGNMWLTIDPAGKLYISSVRGAVRERDVNGDLVTLAGGTVPVEGERNDRGAAALFNNPRGVASDAAGNLYVVDEFNNAVRRITPSGDVTTHYKAPAGATQTSVYTVDANGSYTGKPSNGIRNIAIDANGNVFIDSLDGIQKISPAGLASIVAPSRKNNALATDAAGNLYSMELFSSTIQKTTPAGVVTTITPNDPVATPLDAQGLTLDKAGNFYILSHSGVLKMTPGGVVTPLAAAPTGRTPTVPSTANFSLSNRSNRFIPQSITIDDEGNLYAAYAKGADAMIQRITPQGSTSIVHAYSADEVSTGNHFMPKGIAMTGPGTIAVTSSNAVFQLKF